MMADIFRFKQFDIDQSGCAMKINTDGVLLGALTEANNPATIFDIGTGTGVIALMLAQRFLQARIDVVEIDETAATTAGRNFCNSQFSERLNVHPVGFEQFFDTNPDKKYDLIVSNPPFYINSLKSPKVKKELAKHADKVFFEKLVDGVAGHLMTEGSFWMILPLETAEFFMPLAAGNNLYPQRIINIHSFDNSEAHRVIVNLGFEKLPTEIGKLIIYKAVGIYSEEYTKLLQPFFIAF